MVEGIGRLVRVRRRQAQGHARGIAKRFPDLLHERGQRPARTFMALAKADPGGFAVYGIVMLLVAHWCQPFSGKECGHAAAEPRAACTKAFIRAASLTPGAASTPEDTSTCCAPVKRIASATLSGVRPPASIQGRAQSRPEIKRQSKANPLRRAGLHQRQAWHQPKSVCHGSYAASLGRSAALAIPTAFITGKP